MINIKKVFVNPVTISLVIGLFLFITGIKLPGVINSTMAGVAALNTPAAMIVLGYYLSCVRICDLLLNPSLYLATFVRLIIIPLLTLLVLYIIPVGHGQIGMITLIAAATPGGKATLCSRIQSWRISHRLRHAAHMAGRRMVPSRLA